MMENDPFTIGGDATWLPHVYIMRCGVNEQLLKRAPRLAAREPDWLRELRSESTPTRVDIAEMRARPFIKVGSTYGVAPLDRTTKLSRLAPSVTMTCRNVPVVGKGVIALFIGTDEIEKSLHERWSKSRIDSTREFFWLAADVFTEVGELLDVYREYTNGMSKWW